MQGKLRLPFLLIVTCLAALWVAALAPARMHSHKIAGGLCETTGGKKIVPVPGFPGERIDRRMLPDLMQLVKRYKLFVIDGYSSDPVHASNGEHPMGLAADFAPDFANGGSWHLVTKLAMKAEPVQDQPVAPYRWVGYNGDAGHGRGNHLHLSWSHSELTGQRRFPKTVITKHCPGKRKHGSGDGTPSGGGDNPSGSAHHHGGGNGSSGGVSPGSGGGGNSGGVSPRLERSKHVKLAPPHPESAAESVR